MTIPKGLTRIHPWYPHDEAIKAAVAVERFMDCDDFVDRYLVRCRDLGKTPKSGEWLRWLLDEDAAAKRNDRNAQRGAPPLTRDDGTPTSWSV